MACGLILCDATFAAEDRVTPDEVVGSVQVWLEENVDDWVFELVDIDQATLGETLNAVQQELTEALSPDTAPRREEAEELLSVLREFKATRPYAVRLHDFFDQLVMPAPPTNAPPETPARPTPAATRESWLAVMSGRAAPERAQAYLEQLQPIFQAEKVPPELVWIAEVESSFNPEARSPVGAVGLFQLMPATARSLGLSTWLPDERRNAEKNATAAAKYLRYLHNRFGDWQLALAAYNAGPTRIAKLLRESGSFSYDAIANRVPLETLDYVGKVEATLMVRQGVDLSRFSQPTVTVSE
jgi:membrane-bound lytic murein transglycosylase D